MFFSFFLILLSLTLNKNQLTQLFAFYANIYSQNNIIIRDFSITPRNTKCLKNMTGAQIWICTASSLSLPTRYSSCVSKYDGSSDLSTKDLKGLGKISYLIFHLGGFH